MNINELIRQIKQNENYWSGLALTPQQVNLLANLSANEYAKVVNTFLQESVAASSNLQGIEYRKTYAHLIYGAFLSLLRPNRNLYSVILTSVLGIGDPTSSKYGTAALKQLKPTEQIVFDLFAIAEKHQNNTEMLSHIAWLFYWLGFSESGNWEAEKIVLSLDGGWEKLYQENIEPETSQQEVKKVVQRVAKFMKEYYKPD